MKKYLFELDNLGFRPLLDSDIDYLIELDCDPDVKKYFPGGALTEEQIPAKLKEYQDKYKAQGYGCYLVFDLINDQFIGRAGLSDLSTGETEVGYLIVKELWGKGYATRVTRALLSWCQQNLNKDKVIAFTPIDHKASERVMQKAGMQYLKTAVMPNVPGECVVYQYKLITPKIKYNIILIEPEYIEKFRAAVGSVAREQKYLAFLDTPSLESSRQFVLNNIEHNRPHYIAVIEDEIVGWCDICALDRPVFKHAGTLGIGVIAGYRGCGIGRALITKALEHAKRIGLTRIELTVREHNEVAINLYKKLGFEIEGVHRNSVLINGKYENQIFMALLIDEQSKKIKLP